MTDVRVTTDANLLSSGALRMRDDAAPVRLTDAWLANRFTLVVSQLLIEEVERTLAKPYFTERLTVAQRTAFLDLLRRRAVITPLTVSVAGVATHPEDDLAPRPPAPAARAIW